jgi:hypothetical protein
MKIGKLNLQPFPYLIYKCIKKEGSRIEFSLTINNALINIGKKISSLPLKYASIVLALKSGTNDQIFHKDSDSGERAIIYLTDVLKDTNGPIEFQNGGKVLGPSGTYVHYLASDIHRGCKSDIDRYALAFAFDNDPLKKIETIGYASYYCPNFACPQGTVNNGSNFDPVESNSQNVQACCDVNEFKNGSITINDIGNDLLNLVFSWQGSLCTQISSQNPSFPFLFISENNNLQSDCTSENCTNVLNLFEDKQLLNPTSPSFNTSTIVDGNSQTRIYFDRDIKNCFVTLLEDFEIEFSDNDMGTCDPYPTSSFTIQVSKSDYISAVNQQYKLVLRDDVFFSYADTNNKYCFSKIVFNLQPLNSTTNDNSKGFKMKWYTWLIIIITTGALFAIVRFGKINKIIK